MKAFSLKSQDMIKKTILSLTSAVMLSIGWVGGSGITLLAGFVPLLLLSELYGPGTKNFWKMYGWIALSFGIWSGITTWWIWYAAEIGAILSVLITIGLFGGMFMLFHWVRQRATKALSYTLLVCGWIACEYLYTNGEVSFPWLTLGNGFANDIPLIQWYDTTGVFGGSLWVLLSNLLIYEAVKKRNVKAWILPACVIILPAAISLVKYFSYKETGKPVKVTVVQPNINAYEKFVTRQKFQTAHLLKLAAQAPLDTEFIIFPETAIHEDIWENDINDNHIIKQFQNLLITKYPDTQIIMGASTGREYEPGEKVSETARQYSGGWYDVYNTAFAIETSGVTDIYHKSRLLVGAEKIPYYNIMKNVESLILDLGGATGQHGVDPERKIFDSPCNTKTGTAICWEAVFGEYYGDYIKNGADVMFVISNDGWWSDTHGHRQLFRYSCLRAVESRRAIARSANTGVSGFINQRGDVIQQVGWDKTAVITDTILTNDKITFYVKYGDYIARLACYILGLSILYFIAYRVRRKNLLTE